MFITVVSKLSLLHTQYSNALVILVYFLSIGHPMQEAFRGNCTYFSICLSQAVNRRHILSASSQRPSDLPKEWKHYNTVFKTSIKRDL